MKLSRKLCNFKTNIQFLKNYAISIRKLHNFNHKIIQLQLEFQDNYTAWRLTDAAKTFNEEAPRIQ